MEKYRTLDLLICQSLMEYEDMTVFLLTEGADTVLTAMWTQIRKYVHQRKGIFDITKSSLTFIRSMVTRFYNGHSENITTAVSSSSSSGSSSKYLPIALYTSSFFFLFSSLHISFSFALS